MRIEILEEKIRHDRDEYIKGDQRTVSDELGAYFCGNGWAKDLDGSAETGVRSTTEARLAPDSVSVGNTARVK